MNAPSFAFEGLMERGSLAALLDATGASSTLSPRPLLGAAAAGLPPAMRPAGFTIRSLHVGQRKR